MSHTISRRQLIATLGGAVCARAVLGAQAPLPTQTGPTVVSNPPRDFGPNATLTTYFPDPDVITIDPAFGGLIQGNTPIRRLWTGALWMEGPAWNGQGRYLVWSDIPNNRQHRWLEDDGHVSVFRSPSNTATATRSIRRDGRSPANTRRGASFATSTTGR